MYKEAFGYTLSEHAEGECVTHAHTSERDTERERERECVCVPAQSSPLQHQHWTDLDCDPPGPDMTGGGEEGSGRGGGKGARHCVLHSPLHPGLPAFFFFRGIAGKVNQILWLGLNLHRGGGDINQCGLKRGNCDKKGVTENAIQKKGRSGSSKLILMSQS